VRQIVIYTDGACSGNGRSDAVGGWAAILVDSSGERELSGTERSATNQRMELRAAIEGLRALDLPSAVILYSDSTYVVRCFHDRWYTAWRANGWRNKKKQPIANRELWEELLELVEAHGHVIDFQKVTGHADKLGRDSDTHEVYNQRCDSPGCRSDLRLAGSPAGRGGGAVRRFGHAPLAWSSASFEHFFRIVFGAGEAGKPAYQAAWRRRSGSRVFMRPL
jgi:ribonuclease HI